MSLTSGVPSHIFCWQRDQEPRNAACGLRGQAGGSVWKMPQPELWQGSVVLLGPCWARVWCVPAGAKPCSSTAQVQEGPACMWIERTELPTVLSAVPSVPGPHRLLV